jgi:hypothetical protein
VKQLFDGACDALYTVIYGYNAYNGSDPKANPIGVVNAYDNTIVTASTTAATSTSETASYRTDCPVFEPIHD